MQHNGSNDETNLIRFSTPISATILIFVASSLFAVIWYQAGQDSRLDRAELSIKHIQEQLIQDRNATEKKFDELRVDLRLINSKLDRLIESQSRER